MMSRLECVLSGQGRDRVSHRPVPSLRQKQTRLTDSQRSAVVRRYEAGESAAALAREFDVDRRTLVNHLKRAGVEVRYRIIDQIDTVEAQRLYSAGLSLAEVASASASARGRC